MNTWVITQHKLVSKDALQSNAEHYMYNTISQDPEIHMSLPTSMFPEKAVESLQ